MSLIDETGERPHGELSLAKFTGIENWTRLSILNVARMGTRIVQFRNIVTIFWKVEPIQVELKTIQPKAGFAVSQP